MLYPDEDEKRERCISATAAEAIVQGMPDTALFIGGKESIRALKEAPKLPPFNDDLKRRFLLGTAIGTVVIGMIDDATATLKDSFEEVQNKVKKDRHSSASDIPPIEAVQKNWWPRFKRVSHLWAATVSLKAWTNNIIFPCAIGDIPEFLAAAEYIRHRAEQRRLAMQGDATLLGVGDALAILPTVPLPFPPIAIGGHREAWHQQNDTIAK